MIDMDRLADADQPSRARLEGKMQKSGAAAGFEFVHEFAGLKKVARRSLQSEDRMAVHGLLEKAFNLATVKIGRVTPHAKVDADQAQPSCAFTVLRVVRATLKEKSSELPGGEFVVKLRIGFGTASAM